MPLIPKTGQKLHYTRSNNTSFEDEADIEGIECDTCLVKEVKAEACGFCIQCKYHMCSDCKLDHVTAEATRSHFFLVGHEMPKRKIMPNIQKGVECCDRHSYNMVEYFCPVHSEVFCSECKDYKHGRCRDVTFIRYAAKGIKGDREISKTADHLQKMVFQFEKLKAYKEAKVDRLEDQLTVCLKAVSDMRSQINRAFDTLEASMRKTAEKRFAKEINDAKELRDKCDKRIKLLEHQSKSLENVQSSDEFHCFISLLKAKQTKVECEHALTALSKEKRDANLTFEPNHKLVYFLKDLETMGNIKVAVVRPKSAGSFISATPTPSLDLSSSLLPALQKEKDLTLCGEHTVISADDRKKSCTISGSAFLPDGRLLLCDNKNNCLKLFDQHFHLKSTRKLPAAPSDVTALTNREAIVTVPDKRQLHFIIMDPNLRTTRVVHTEGACYGIRSHKDGLLVTCYNHGVFGMAQLLDNDGVVKQRYDRDVDGNALFQGPYNIALNRKRDRFYVSDRSTNSVICLTMGGTIVFRFRTKDLKGPGYMTVDKEGSVYICGRDSGNIHVIKPDGRKIKTLPLDQGFEPSSISYRAADGMVVISSELSDVIKCYKLL